MGCWLRSALKVVQEPGCGIHSSDQEFLPCTRAGDVGEVALFLQAPNTWKIARNQAEADQRWLEERGGIDPAKRLIEWEKWLRNQLRSRLKWPEDKTKREKLIDHCMAEITKMVRQIHGRGWLLDGKALLGPHRSRSMTRSRAALLALFPALGGQHAEEIQFNARQTGGDLGFTTIGSAIAGLGINGQKSAKMTELIVENAKRFNRPNLSGSGNVNSENNSVAKLMHSRGNSSEGAQIVYQTRTFLPE